MIRESTGPVKGFLFIYNVFEMFQCSASPFFLIKVYVTVFQKDNFLSPQDF